MPGTHPQLLANRSLVLDLVEWLAKRPRPYRDVMDAWRTSCTRLAIWEDALDLVRFTPEGVTATDAAFTWLARERPARASGR
jgi:hypothetical protein